MRTFMFLPAILVMTACKPAQEAKSPPSSSQQQSVNYAAEIAALPQQARDAALFRAIRDAGLPCQQIIASSPMADTAPGTATWRAQCEDKAYHLIRIQPDGSAVVTSRVTP